MTTTSQIPESLSVNGTEYKIISLLGKGKGGYSYLAESAKKERFVLKQIHHEPCDYYKFGNKIESECNDYERLCKIGIKMPKMICVDKTNERILKEYIEGETIFDLVKNEAVKDEYISQLREMCRLLYKSNTNIDYFPTNFIVRKNTDGTEELFYIDYECNDYMEEWNFENWGIKYWSRTEEFLKCLE